MSTAEFASGGKKTAMGEEKYMRQYLKGDGKNTIPGKAVVDYLSCLIYITGLERVQCSVCFRDGYL